MSTHHTYHKSSDGKTKKPLRLIVGTSPKTSVFEKQLGLINSSGGNYYFTTQKSPKRRIGCYNPPSPGSSISESSNRWSLEKGHHFYDSKLFRSQDTTMFVDVVPDQEIRVKIPLHRVRSTYKGLSNFFCSLTTSDLDWFADCISYITAGGFAVLGDNILLTNKEAFMIMVPIVLVSILKISMKEESNVMHGHLVEDIVSQRYVSYESQKVVIQAVAFLKVLMLLLFIKITAVLKHQIDPKSKPETAVLGLMGVLIIGIIISLFQNCTSALRMVSVNMIEGKVNSGSTTPTEYVNIQKNCNRKKDEPGSPLYEDYCILNTPESLK
ncbi:CYFA0S02e02355g1_1 [Cyberlindnera fabianii]|uniref:CYFA0S02e02355g1_1 n=1 Tax=Cyberlindnera fabianii TaxID=36022 RepID=A0A061AT45_CYBFA|nr:hypothetical protein BON22_4124 [Cyberlindnera fabianii]CDR38499.1 CYFA0S02e02355g1_1 [Cyberlindnera fabianii]